MHRLLVLVALLAAPAFAQGEPADTGPSYTAADPIPTKPPLQLTDEQRTRVAQAVIGQNTLEKPPEGFTPAVGATVPPQARLAAHPLPRPLVYEIPVLKQYHYAQLPDSVLIIDPMTKTIADIVKR